MAQAVLPVLQAPGNILIPAAGDLSGAIKIPVPAIVKGTFTVASLPAGSSVINGTAVPSGKLWVITLVNSQYSGVVAGVVLRPGMYEGTHDYFFSRLETLVSGNIYSLHTIQYLAVGEFIRLTITGATVGNSATLEFRGYEITL